MKSIWTSLSPNKFTLCYAFAFMISCTRKVGTKMPSPAADTIVVNASYTKHIKPLVTEKCATTGCHIANFPFGDFTQYSDLKAKVTNGKLNLLVFDKKLMPPATYPQLTTDQYQLLKTWVDNGAIEN
ncbi:MAG: hypothetical protein JNL60_19800 [Bacteroidia bacterium]|nr:hypothetical protein [Bacteroidia bacterium]